MTEIEIKKIVIETLEVILNENSLSIDEVGKGEIFGINGVLNSLAVLRFVVDLEEAFYQKNNLSINLTSENAFNPINSPFKKVDSIVALILENINKDRI